MLEAARALPRDERAEIARELIGSLETTNEYDEARYAELRAAVDEGIASLDAGEALSFPMMSVTTTCRSVDG